MTSTSDLSRLTNLEVRLYRLTTRSHLRVGAGEGSADVAVENPIIRALILDDTDKERRVPYIPGSSLHGVIRAWVEKALRSGQEPLTGVGLKARVEDLDGVAAENLRAKVEKEVHEFLGRKPKTDEVYDHWRVYTNPHVCNPLSEVDKCERITWRENETPDPKIAWWEALSIAPPCAVCRIFGYMGQRGRVKLTHAWPTTDQPPLDVITRVAINRLTGAADEGKLFDLEAIPPGVSFHFFVVMENMDDEDKDRFEMGVRALNLQLAGLGAHATVGFGMVDIDRQFRAVISPKIFKHNIEQEFIQPTLEGKPKALIELDETKLPRFFRALVAARPAQQVLDKQIEFLE